MGKFVLSEAKGGYKFNLKAGNGEIIAVSEVYTTEAAALKGINSVRVNSAAEIEDQTVEGFATIKNPKFEVYEDKAGKCRFRLKAKNGQIIAVSEAYNSKSSCMNGVASVKKNAPEAELVKEF